MASVVATIFGAIAGKIPVINTLIDRLVPDKNANAQAKLELLKLAQEQEGQQLLGQLAINLAEAQSPHWFVAAWRPALGWMCVAAFGYSFVLQPFLVFIVLVFTKFDAGRLPHLDMVTMLTILGAMLGMSTIRQVDKGLGTDTKQLGQ